MLQSTSINLCLGLLPNQAMGIRFFCHHCQSRLHVKFSQAGRPGICPDCGATIDVPAESLLPGPPKSPSQRFYMEDTNPLEGSSQLIDFESQDTMVGDMAGEPATPPKNGDAHDSLSPVFATTNDSSSGIFMLDRPSLSPDFGKVDPIEAAPDKVWYFRNKDLGELGPLKSKIMQRHIDCGDVVAGCMVWREDWEDWASAEAAFPQIPEAVDSIKDAQPSQSKSDSSTNGLSGRHLFSKRVSFYAMIAAGLVVVFALAYVVLILSRS